MDHLMTQQRVQGFPGLQGTTMRVRFPLRTQALNKILRDTLQKDVEIISLHSTVSHNDRIRIHASIRIQLITVKVTLPLERKMSLSRTPMLYAQIGGFLGFASRLLQPVLKHFLSVPYIHLNGDRIELNWHQFLHVKGLADLINYIDSIEIDIQNNITVLSLHIGVM